MCLCACACISVSSWGCVPPVCRWTVYRSGQELGVSSVQGTPASAEQSIRHRQTCLLLLICLSSCNCVPWETQSHFSSVYFPCLSWVFPVLECNCASWIFFFWTWAISLIYFLCIFGFSSVPYTVPLSPPMLSFWYEDVQINEILRWYCWPSFLLMKTFSETAVSTLQCRWTPPGSPQVSHKSPTTSPPLLWQAHSPLKPYSHACTHSS